MRSTRDSRDDPHAAVLLRPRAQRLNELRSAARTRGHRGHARTVGRRADGIAGRPTTPGGRYRTTIVPVIPGWNTQAYETRPARVAVQVNSPPASIVPESNAAAPLVAVTVCATASALDQRTVWPCATVSCAGSNWLAAIRTSIRARRRLGGQRRGGRRIAADRRSGLANRGRGDVGGEGRAGSSAPQAREQRHPGVA